MSEMSRRELIKASGAGALGAGLVLAGSAGLAQAAPAGSSGVHIHGTVSAVVDREVVSIDIDVNVTGPPTNLSGNGWDVGEDRTAADLANACYYTQAGSWTGNTVHLEGIVLLSNNPALVGVRVTADGHFPSGGSPGPLMTSCSPVPASCSTHESG